jgi:hypothetical protein
MTLLIGFLAVFLTHQQGENYENATALVLVPVSNSTCGQPSDPITVPFPTLGFNKEETTMRINHAIHSAILIPFDNHRVPVTTPQKTRFPAPGHRRAVSPSKPDTRKILSLGRPKPGFQNEQFISEA